MNLREALNPDLIGFDGHGNVTLPQEAFEAVHAAGRRFLALTETGPDYEAAYDELGHIEPSRVKQAVDAALADYLTEEKL